MLRSSAIGSSLLEIRAVTDAADKDAPQKFDENPTDGQLRAHKKEARRRRAIPQVTGNGASIMGILGSDVHSDPRPDRPRSQAPRPDKENGPPREFEAGRRKGLTAENRSLMGSISITIR